MLSHGTFSTRGKYWLICQFSLSIFSLFSLYCDITYASFLFVWRQYIDRPRASRHASNRSMLPWHATHPAALACSPSAGARFAIRIYSMRALCIFMFLQFSLFFNYGGKQCFFFFASPRVVCKNTRESSALTHVCQYADTNFKVSEGLDFADSRARLVLLTGIPYAPAMDPKVTQATPTSFLLTFMSNTSSLKQ